MIEVKCDYCGNVFFTYPSNVAKNKKIFCSKSCYHKSLKKQNKIIMQEDFAYMQILNKKGEEIYLMIDKEDIEKISKHSWHLNCGKYARNTEKMFLHRLIMNCPDDKVVDHINHNTFDNRKQNLRICTSFSNCQNIITNKSGKPGVSQYRDGKWIATLKDKGRKIYLGRFETFMEAKRARELAEIKYQKV